MQQVEIIEWQPDWAKDFDVLAARVRAAGGSSVLRVDHIGSTAVPGLAAKDCIDVQAIVHSLFNERLFEGLLSAGFTQAPGTWNLRDHIPEGWNGDPAAWDKLVFRPPAGTRTGNVHVLVAGSLNEQYALLFRDFLTHDEAAREGWAEFSGGWHASRPRTLLRTATSSARPPTYSWPLRCDGLRRRAGRRCNP